MAVFVNNSQHPQEESGISSYLEDPLLPPSNDDEEPFLAPEANDGDDERRVFDLNSAKRSNVRRILALTWFAFMGKAIWSQSVLSMFVFLMHPRQPERVGYISAVMGTSQVLSSIPANYLSQTWDRHHLLQIASVVGVGAIGLTVYATFIHVDFYYLLGGLSAWGVMWGITDAAMPSLFADSIPETDQNVYYKRGSRVIRSSNALGPVVIIGLFLYLGNEWTLRNCSIVISVGLGFCIPVLFLLCCLWEPDDVRDPPREILLRDAESQDKFDCQNNSDLTGNTEAVSALLLGSELDEGSNDDYSTTRECCAYRQSTAVVSLIAISDMLSGIASGISLRYFPVFLVGSLHLSPIEVQVLFIATPLGQATFKLIAKGLARMLGASIATVLLQWAYVTVIGSMVYYYQGGASTVVVCALYLTQAFLMNSTGALTESILASSLPEGQSDKGIVAEQIQLFLWSVGATAGGYVAGTYQIIDCFFVTAALQLFASLPIALLCCTGPTPGEVNVFSFPSDSSNPEGLDEEGDFSQAETLFEETTDAITDADSAVYFDCVSTQSDTLTQA